MTSNDESTLNLNPKKLLIVIVSLQLAFLGLIALDNLGLGIPILRQVLGFLYLTFVPGILLLGVFRINNLNTLETLLYSAGLSLSFLMFIGFLMNFFYPLIGISKPISEIPLVITISAIVLFLCFICYLRNKNYPKSFSININQVFSPFFLSLSLLPFLAVFGTYLLNFYDNNTLLLTLLTAISLIPLLVSYDKISNEKYPIVVWIISISLLLHNSLIGEYVSWGDSEGEYLISKLVLINEFWDPNTPSITANSLLSLAMLHPIYSIACDIELTWVYKVVYPFLFSATPVALYLAFKKQTNEKIAFLSSSLFMFSYIFFTVLSRNTRTGISFFFLSLLILIVSNKKLRGVERAILLLTFLLSIAVTYYGITYMLLLFLFLVILLHYLDKNRDKNRVVAPTLAFLFVTFSITWYMYTSNSCGFDTIVHFANNYVDQFTELLTAPRSSPTYYLEKKWSVSLEVVRYLYVILIFFTTIGILDLIYKIIKGKEIGFSKDYSFFSLVSCLFLFATLSPLPGNIQRILQILLPFLAPFSVTGCVKLFTMITSKRLSEDNVLRFFAFILLVLLVFDSGLISATLTHDMNPNELINKPLINGGTVEEKKYFFTMYLPDYDVYSSRWLLNSTEGIIKIYNGRMFHYGGVAYHYGLSGIKRIKTYLEESPMYYAPLSEDTNEIEEGSYVHLGYFSYREGLIVGQGDTFATNKIYPLLNALNKIYDNGGAAVYEK
ncbi:MAG: hypothetical protein DRJ64_10635 [Thermoprotei archaeon]|nr:MAG: hypothetical protein DRJ64_10635 [Thermoprotei archaeon]